MEQPGSMMEVRHNDLTGQRHLYALRGFSADEIIIPFRASEVYEAPTYLTLQTGINSHIILDPEILQYCNHSCDPNVFFDTTTMDFVALTAIAPGDELTFFYPSTEWDMAQPFACFCGSTQCLGTISGAAHMHPDTLSRYQLTDFIREQLKARTEALLPA